MTRFRMLALVAAPLVLTTACGGGAKADPHVQPLSAIELDTSYTRGRVDPPPKAYKVPKGEDVRITIFSSATDVLHLHGYEKKVTISAGFPAYIEFVADKTGLFDLDMQRVHRKLLQIKVS